MSRYAECRCTVLRRASERFFSHRLVYTKHFTYLGCFVIYTAAYQLPDEFYRCSARRDLGLPPTEDRMLPRKCAACRLRVIHHVASSGCTWRDAGDIGNHLVNSIAIAVQRCNGKALQASMEREARVALGVTTA